MSLDFALYVEQLRDTPVAELREQYATLLGHATTSRHKSFLVRQIARASQVAKERDISQRARDRAKVLAQDFRFKTLGNSQTNRSQAKPPDSANNDPKPGTTIVRKYKGRTLEVIVGEGTFEFEDNHYSSLTAVAKTATGSNWNGRLFFGLSKRGGTK